MVTFCRVQRVPDLESGPRGTILPRRILTRDLLAVANILVHNVINESSLWAISNFTGLDVAYGSVCNI